MDHLSGSQLSSSSSKELPTNEKKSSFLDKTPSATLEHSFVNVKRKNVT